MRWIDLSPYDGARLEILNIIKADGETRCLMVNNAREYLADGLKWIGFQPLKEGKIWISQTQTIDPDRFYKVFPDVKTIDVDLKDVTRVIDQRPKQQVQNPVENPPVVINGTPSKAKNTPDNSTLIYNVGGFMVREFADGTRCNRDLSANSFSDSWTFEANYSFSPSKFLRVNDDTSIQNVLLQHFDRVLKEGSDSSALNDIQPEDHLDLIKAMGFDVSDEKIQNIWNSVLITWARNRATSPRHGLNIKIFYDITSRMIPPGMNSMSAPVAVALFRSLRPLPRSDRNKTVTIWDPVFNEVIDFRTTSLPEYKENRQLVDGRLAIMDLSRKTENIDPVEIDGITATRRDQYELLKVLSTRDADGKTFVLWRESNAHIVAEDEMWWDLACRYTVEGRIWLDKSMLNFGDDRAVLFILGGRRPEILEEPHEASMRRRDAKGWQDLWAWTSDVMVNREKIRKYYDNSGSDIRNTLQVAYEPMSKSFSHEMLPKNLEIATREAQQKFLARHPDVDQYVANLIGMDKKELLESKMLSAAQIDVIGLFNDAFERGYRGVANFDQTGMGKGRFCAVMAQIAASGNIPKHPEINRAILITERPINIDDLIKDLRDTNAFNKGNIKIGIMNANITTTNHLTREEENFSVPEDVMTDAIENKKWPEGYNILITTYTQFNQLDMIPEPGQSRKVIRSGRARMIPNTSAAGKKVAWLKAVADKTTALIRDESHNGAVNSATGKNILFATQNSGVVIDSSGSYARTLDEIIQYGHIFPNSVARRDMPKILRAGGSPVIQAMITSAVRSGNVIRREHNAMRRNLVMARPTDNEAAEYRMKKDAMAAVLSEISYMTGFTSKRVNETNVQLIDSYINQNPAFAEALQRLYNDNQNNAIDRIVGTLPKIKMRNMGSARAAIAFLFVSSLTIKKTVDLAIDCLQRGRKPIIVVESTGETVIKAMIEAGDDENAENDIKINLQFRDMLYRLVRNSITGYLEETNKNADAKAAQAEIDHIENLIKAATRSDEGYNRLKNYVNAYNIAHGAQPAHEVNTDEIEDDHAAHISLIDNGDGPHNREFHIPESFTIKNAKKIVSELRKKARHMRKEIKRKKFLATTQKPETMRGYIGSKARRILLAMPDIGDIARNKDKTNEFVAAVHKAMDEAAGLALLRGYAEKNYVTPLLHDLKAEISAAILEDGRIPADQANDPESKMSILMPILPLDLAAYLVRIEDMIETLPDTPCNVIDEIKDAIKAAGYTIGEITGRKIEVVNGVPQPRNDNNRNEIRDRFNGYGDRLNALIANKTGLTGLNFNSCELFPDKDPRSIIMHEILRDSISTIQADGRIGRMNNITDPEVIVPLLDLVCQNYLIAMADKKISTWSAGITANSQNALMMNEVVDMFNVIGDRVATAYLMNHPDLANKLSMTMTTDEEEAGLVHWRNRLAHNAQNNGGIDHQFINHNMAQSRNIGEQNRLVQEAEMALSERGIIEGNRPVDASIPGIDQDNSVNRRGGRTKISSGADLFAEQTALYRMATLVQKLIMLPDSEEKVHMSALQCEFEAVVAELDAQGKNPMRTQFIDAKVHVIESVPLSGVQGQGEIPGDPEGNGFSSPVLLERVAIEYQTQPIRSGELEQLVYQKRDLSEYYSGLVDQSEDGDMRWHRVMPHLSAEDEMALTGSIKLRNIREEANNVRWAVSQIKPGKRVDVIVDTERRIGIVTGIKAKISMYHRLSSYDVSFVVPGDSAERTVNLKTLMADQNFDVLPGLESEHREEVLKDFDEANDTRRVTKRLMLTGNLWEAMDFIQNFKCGHMVSWEAADKTIQRGILVNKSIGGQVIPTPIISSSVIDHMKDGSFLSNQMSEIVSQTFVESGFVQKGKKGGIIKIKCTITANGDKKFDFWVSTNMKGIIGNVEIFTIMTNGLNANNTAKRKSLKLVEAAVGAGAEISDEIIIEAIKNDIDREIRILQRLRTGSNQSVIDDSNKKIAEYEEKIKQFDDPEFALLEVKDFRDRAVAKSNNNIHYDPDDTVSNRANETLFTTLDAKNAKKLVDLLIGTGITIYGDGYLRSKLLSDNRMDQALEREEIIGQNEALNVSQEVFSEEQDSNPAQAA